MPRLLWNVLDVNKHISNIAVAKNSVFSGVLREAGSNGRTFVT